MADKQNIQQFLVKATEREKLDEDKRKDEFALEFLRVRIESEDFKDDPLYSCSVGETMKNTDRNRYRDVLPYNKTRVKLAPVEGSKKAVTPNQEPLIDLGLDTTDSAKAGGSNQTTASTHDIHNDYINASYVKGYKGQTYVAAQAPLLTTAAHFWLMIDQLGIEDVVMLCGLIEQGRPKCVRYWPERCNDSLRINDSYVVTMKSEQSHSEGQIYSRHLILKCTRDHKKTVEKKIRHYQFTSWPDYGSPADFRMVLQLLKLVHEKHDSAKPMLVHCSAGCGRTGAIIAIDIAWQRLKHHEVGKEFSIVDLVLDLRKQRPAMVQSLEQYILIYHSVTCLFEEHLEKTGSTKSLKTPNNAAPKRDQSPTLFEKTSSAISKYLGSVVNSGTASTSGSAAGSNTKANVPTTTTTRL